MGFQESPGAFLASVLRATVRAAVGLIVLIWAVFALTLSWKLAFYTLAYLGRTLFFRPW